jgi:hypothetical protein
MNLDGRVKVFEFVGNVLKNAAEYIKEEIKNDKNLK